jgi:hypothetical protein
VTVLTGTKAQRNREMHLGLNPQTQQHNRTVRISQISVVQQNWKSVLCLAPKKVKYEVLASTFA